VDQDGSPNVDFNSDCVVGSGQQTPIIHSLFPNPTTHSITILTKSPERKELIINTMNGQLIYSTKMKGTTLQIDLSPFQKGVYFITIRSEDFVTTRKVIKL
jgi:hypothetical protein